MVYLSYTSHNIIIPEEQMQREFGKLDVLVVKNIKEGIEAYSAAKNLPWKREVRVLSPQNMQRALQIKNEMDNQVKWFKSFDDIGIPNCRFDESVDMWGRRELVNEWALLLTKGALPSTGYYSVDEHGSDYYPIRKSHLDHLAQFTTRMDRPNLYLALSQNKADREIAKKVVDKIYERFQSKRERKIEERINMIKQILNLDHIVCDYELQTPQETPAPVQEEKPKGLLRRLLG